MRSIIKLSLFFALPLLAVPFTTVRAQWSANPSLNTPVAVVGNEQYGPSITTDGSEGTIMAWEDHRAAINNTDIYAQRFDAAGVPLWTPNGEPVCTAALDQFALRMVSDGSGGAVIVWIDDQNGFGFWDVYAQRIDSNGTVLWTANGVPLCTAVSAQADLSVIPDGTGGAFVAWEDYRSGDYNIYAQRINGSGTVLWTADGVLVCGLAEQQVDPSLTADDSGGVYIAWTDRRNTTDYDVYAQRLTGSGAPLWAGNGVLVTGASYDQLRPFTVRDGLGGVIVTWSDWRNAADFDIYAERLSRDGTSSWYPSGLAVCAAGLSQTNPVILSDGSTGAIIAWEDYRSGVRDVYVQRMNGSGVPLWTANGVGLCTAPGDQWGITLVSDGLGGAIVSWTDSRYGTYSDVYAARIDHAGVPAWSADGVIVSDAAHVQVGIDAVSDGESGAVLVWGDYRSGTSFDIYAGRIDRMGYLGDARPSIVSVNDVGNDQGGAVQLNWIPSYVDTWPTSTVMQYAVYRGVEAGAEPTLQPVAGLDIPSEVGGGKPGGEEIFSFVAPLTTAGSQLIYWEKIGDVAAEWLDGYSFTAPTPSDSGPGGIPTYYFMVRAKTASPSVFWSSAPDSGYSVDNLPPSAVTGLMAAEQAGPVVDLSWTPNTSDQDVASYEVYRSPPGAAEFTAVKIGETADTVFTDGSPAEGAVNSYYIVTVDQHGNRSTPSDEAGVAVGTTVLYPVADRWNMVSVPLTLSDYTASTVYGSAVSSVFAFEGSYVAKSTLTHGQGYWVKFSGGQNISLHGVFRESDSISLQAGWNLIGSVSGPVPVGNITSDPPGIVTSQFFSYAGSYQTSSTVDPGMGYWVKTGSAGTIYLSSASTPPGAGLIRIVHTGELPPDPPGVAETPSLPVSYTLDQNYPNPFNPQTDIRFGIPREGHVRLEVFNPLGERVAVLTDGVLPQGYHTVRWDGSDLPSGVYVYRLVSEDARLTGKMMLLR